VLPEARNLEQVVTLIQQRWGRAALRKLAAAPPDAPALSTGHAALDALLGRGGVPRGAITCLAGGPTSGATTLALRLIAAAQADGEVAVYLDAERALDAEYAVRQGVDLARLLMVWPQPRALGLSIARDVIAQGGAGIVVFDLRCADGASEPLEHPAVITQIAAALRRHAYALVCLVAPQPDALSRALLRAADVHLALARTRWLVRAGSLDGYEVRVIALKNKFAAPQQAATLPIALASRQRGPDE